MAEQVRFELTHEVNRLSVFKTAPLNHLGTAPYNTPTRHRSGCLLDDVFGPLFEVFDALC